MPRQIAATIDSNNRGPQATSACVQQYSSRKKNIYRRTFAEDRPCVVEVFLAMNEELFNTAGNLYILSIRKGVLPENSFLNPYKVDKHRLPQTATV